MLWSMGKVSLRSLLAALCAGFLLLAGLTAPAHAAVAVTYSTKNLVRPGLTNTVPLQITLTGLPNVYGAKIDFVGVTMSNTVYWTDITTSSGAYATCSGTDVGMMTGITVTGSCINSAGTNFMWDGAGAKNVGGTMSFNFPAGSLTFASSGPYSVTPSYNGGSQGSTTLGLPLTPQYELSVSSTSGTFGTPLTLTTSGGTGNGAVTYAVSNGANTTGCSLDGNGALTSTSAGTCLVTATKAADSTYDSKSSSPTVVTLGKASRTLTFGSTTSYPLAYGDTQTVIATASPGNGDGKVTYSVSSGTACTVGSDSGVIKVIASTGSCVVSAAIAEGTNYLSAVTTTQVSVNGSVRAITITAATSAVNYGTVPSATATVTTGSLVDSQTINNGATTFTYTGTGGTTYGPSTTAPQNAGTYSVVPSEVTITGGSASNYNVTYMPGTLTINKASRALSFATVSYSLDYGSIQTVVASTVGDGTISYSAGSSTACRVDSATGDVSIIAGVGTCSVSASITAGTNHLAAVTTTSVAITVSKRLLTVAASSPTIMQGSSFTTSFEVTSGSLAGSDAISGVTYRFAGISPTTYSSSPTAPTAIGTYSITPSATAFSTGDAANYNISYVLGTLTITSKTARTLSFATLSYNLEYGDTSTVAATPSAGLSDGVITYSAGNSTACSVNTSTGEVTITSPTGTCLLSASIAEGATHVAATTASSVTVTVNPRAITITANSPTVAYGSAVTPSFSITSGELVGSDEISELSYAFAGSGSTSFASSAAAPELSGTYSVTPSAAIFRTGSASDYSITYAAGTLIISEAPEVSAGLQLTVPVGSNIIGSPLTFAATGLLPSAAYEIVVRSTPRTIASGFAVGGAVNSSATIPDGLEAGWHSLTFNSTAADGTLVEEVLYFKISASGMLLSTSEGKPAELALTGFDASQFLAQGMLLMLVGFGLTRIVANRRRSVS